jgi:hypothetical protein
MVVRLFRARIREGCVDEFKRMVQEQSIPWLEGRDDPGGGLGDARVDARDSVIRFLQELGVVS